MRRLALLTLVISAPALASFINYASREINVKIVYYGGETAGLAENLEYVYGKTNPEAKGKLISLATETDRTLFFDFLPLSLGEIRGFKTRFHLYTVPGKVTYDASRKLILKGVDGLVFVWDADPKQLVANLQSWRGLQANLAEQGYDWKKTPLVVQIDTRRYKGPLSTETIKRDLGVDAQPVFVADPTTGAGVFDSLKGIAKLVLLELKKGATDAPAQPSAERLPAPGGPAGPRPPAPPGQKEDCGIYAAAPGGGCVADRAKAVAAIRASRLPAKLEAALLPTVWLEPKSSTKPEPAPGAQSQLAGLPDLPPGVEWPRLKGRPLELLAQLHLDDLPALDVPSPLPKLGWLWAFCPVSDPDWAGETSTTDCRVLYFDGPKSALRRANPPGRELTTNERSGLAVQLTAGFTLPAPAEAGLHLTDNEYEGYEGFRDTISGRSGDHWHRVLGFPEEVQGDPRLECVAAVDRVAAGSAKAAAAAEQWVLLMQIDSDERAGFMFGDAGSVYFMIRKKDLAAKKFGQVCALVQSN